MRCADHSRAHCQEPRCYVLAVCAADVPNRYRSSAAVPYPFTTHPGQAMAARLAAWMRAPWTERKPGPLRIMVEGDIPEGVWAEYGPGHYHPLDAVMLHADRVAALASKCPTCKGDGSGHHNPRWKPGRWDPPTLPCDHDGINWATVAALLDQMDAHGISLDVVHEWRAQCDQRSLDGRCVLAAGHNDDHQDDAGNHWPARCASPCVLRKGHSGRCQQRVR